ncbi:MAG: hypothetical protein V1859_02530 [archaeon]
MPSNLHIKRVDYWYNKGITLGYEVFKEYKFDSLLGDSIDCIWKKDDSLIFIEVECSLRKVQIWKNLTKAVHLHPEKIIVDCKTNAIYQYVEKVKSRINVPVEIHLFSDAVVMEFAERHNYNFKCIKRKKRTDNELFIKGVLIEILGNIKPIDKEKYNRKGIRTVLNEILESDSAFKSAYIKIGYGVYKPSTDIFKLKNASRDELNRFYIYCMMEKRLL